MKKYIAKANSWFKEGTECKLIEDFGNIGGIYRGIYVIDDTEYDSFWQKKGYKSGDEVLMNEFCEHEEFDVLLEEETNK